jgi:AcrR family transcriptional regulator
MKNSDIPISDPTPDLAPTAKRILDAAQRVLSRDGFRALTFAAIAKEAGENPALIRYHFGSKAGLISMLVDAVLYQEAVELIETLSAKPPGEDRRSALFELHRRMAQDVSGYDEFYELIPNLLRDPELKPKLRDLMTWYRALDAWALAADGGEPDSRDADALELQPLSMLTVAVLDGVALQVEADPELDVGPAYELWESLVLRFLEECDREAGRP